MTDQVLDILKLVLLALLYLFFARVLWTVWSEVRSPANARQAVDFRPPLPQPAPTPSGGIPDDGRRATKPTRGRGGVPGRLVVLEPKDRKGTTFAIGDLIGIGRESDNAILVTDDAYISSHHARVSRSGDKVVVDDLASRNGTYVNGTRVTQRQTLHVGDRIQIGYTVLEAQ